MNTLFIDPGSPWENGYIESFNGKLRDELLEREAFDTLLEANGAFSNGGGSTPTRSGLTAASGIWPIGPPADWVRRVKRPQTAAELAALRTSVRRGLPRWGR